MLSLKSTKTQASERKTTSINSLTELRIVAFYRQSLQIQKLHAELYHNATALRGIDGPEDVQSMYNPVRQ